jgi:hypothetical protein
VSGKRSGGIERRSSPPLRDQPAALVPWRILDRLLDCRLLVRLVINDADALGWRAADVIDGPGVVALRLDRSLRHCEGDRRQAIELALAAFQRRRKLFERTADQSRQDLDRAPCRSLRAWHHGYLSADENGEWLTLRDAAATLGVSHHQVRKLIKAAVLVSKQIMPDAPHQIRAADLASEQVVAALKRKGRPCRVDSENQISMSPDA